MAVASSPPQIGPTQKTQWFFHSLATAAGPKERAGLTLQEHRLLLFYNLLRLMLAARMKAVAHCKTISVIPKSRREYCVISNPGMHQLKLWQRHR